MEVRIAETSFMLGFVFEEDVVKAVFQRQQKNFRAYLDEISKTKLDLDSNSEAAVKAYFDTQTKIRTK